MATPDPPPPAPAGTKDLRLTTEEVRQLWSFVHGDIMDPEMRRQLRASYGLCPRHSWAYAVVEIELWTYGPGARGGHQPFDVAILYKDLLEHAATELTRRRILAANLASVLTAGAACRICEELSAAAPSGAPVGYAGSDTAALTEEANRLTFTTAWLRQTERVWRPWVCPVCAAEAGVPRDRQLTADDAGRTCRPHLLAARDLPRHTADRVGARLLETADLLGPLIESMTDRGRPATTEEDASWVAALGWFAGWAFPLAVHVSDEGAGTAT
ncbi:hypothetical protein [Georgenia muralis]|uniref:Uncharacterized protein n=1 Tax=Georgenia muralis TaxID=154117 RepID=A0A3N5A8P5_9MICO|nr:hypothetical protein [Georgenia muralis]RPF28031.1 hypothetical protein EDD32_2540 [Georgenia muralis]